MAEETYNGWANWETWSANLWLTNDEGTYTYMMETVGGATNDYVAGDRIKAVVEELADEGIKLIGDEMSQHRIDWAEIGEWFLEVVREAEEG